MECSVSHTQNAKSVSYAKFRFKPLKLVYLEKHQLKITCSGEMAKSPLLITDSKTATNSVNAQRCWSKSPS